MSTSQELIAQLDYLSPSTRKLLERVPEARFGWKPHEKSMSLARLAAHVAELPAWFASIMEHDQIDFATFVYKPLKPSSTAEIVTHFEEKSSAAKEAILAASDADFAQHYKICHGDTVYSQGTKAEIIRREMAHFVHHRGQLSVYLRMLDVPLPNLHGPTADER